MAIVRPFKALRPKKQDAEKLTSPPYDVLNSQEAAEMAKGNPLSLLHVTKPEIDLPSDIDPYDQKVYDKARENMELFTENGYLVQDETPMFYLYRQTMPIGDSEHTQLGLIACASVDEYETGIIKKHELTRKDKEDDRTKHVFITNANTGPVFLTYKAKESIDKLFAKIEKETTPEYDFTAPDGIKHIMWKIDNPEEIEQIKKEFAAVPILYVADGHHRSASAMRVREMMKLSNPHHTGDEEYNFFLTVIFPDNQMNIMAYNRVLKNLNGNSPEQFISKIEEKFEIKEEGKEPPTPPTRHTFGMYMGGKGYILTPKQGSFDEKDPVASLDVSILQNNLLSPILAIQNPREDKNIDFVGGIRGNGELKKLVDSGKFKVAFSMYPTSIGELFAVADAGLIMPPKSTWFEPKLRDGITIHTI